MNAHVLYGGKKALMYELVGRQGGGLISYIAFTLLTAMGTTFVVINISLRFGYPKNNKNNNKQSNVIELAKNFASSKIEKFDQKIGIIHEIFSTAFGLHTYTYLCIYLEPNYIKNHY